MKKLFFAFTMLILSEFSFGQAISEYAIIPVSVTLNSVFRLSVVSGGNIEWVINTIDQYNTGIAPDARYETRFTVSSSLDYKVQMRAEDDLIGQDNPGNVLNLNNIGYFVRSNGTADAQLDASGDLTIPSLTGTGVVGIPTTLGASIITGIVNLSAGDATKNDFSLEWRLGTGVVDGLPMNAQTLLQQSIPADRYITNIFLELSEL